MNKENGVASMQFRVKGIECRITDRLAKNGGPYCGADHPEFVHPASQFFQRRIHVRQRENREHLELLGVLAGELRAKQFLEMAVPVSEPPKVSSNSRYSIG